MDVNFRRLLRSVVGPPGQTNWLNPWHEILHDWNARVARYVQEAGILTSSQRSLQQYWQLCSYIAGLPDARWASRILVWRPRNTGKRGAPLRLWHSAAETFCRWKGLGDWIFFFPLLFQPQKSRILGLFYWAVSRHWTKRKELAISIPVAPALRGSWPSPSQGSLRRGWEAAGLGGWVWGLGQELAPERIIPFHIGKMGAVLVEEAGGKGLQGSMGQLGRPSVDEGSCHRVLEEAGCLSGLRVREEPGKQLL